LRMMWETGCDAVLVARGALGNPWIFREAAQFLRDGTVPPRPTREELTATMTAHFDLCEEYYGGKLAPKVFRKFFSCYTRGLPGAKSLRQSAFGARTREETLEIIAALRSLGG
ncbi:MAG: tRNA-dihydrouridine synthase, partial [Candidatus Aureabacteria bacterium]|nr:tRNA-dihydrouridine synthase [Candidatus Auribacterota bacterium]